MKFVVSLTLSFLLHDVPSVVRNEVSPQVLAYIGISAPCALLTVLLTSEENIFSISHQESLYLLYTSFDDQKYFKIFFCRSQQLVSVSL